MNILITDPLSSAGIDILKKAGHAVVERFKIPEDELTRIVNEYDVLLVRSGTIVTPGIIEKMDRTRLIGRAGAGVDNIDVEAATRRHVLVMNTPGGNTRSAAEHTIAMLFAMARNIPFAHAELTGGTWDRKRWKGIELQGKTLGVIGFGKIGREVAAMAACLGMRVIATDDVVGSEIVTSLGYEFYSLEGLCRNADIITIHVPLMTSTRNLFGDAQFGACRPGVRIINCARGGILNEDALVRALASGVVAGAALDVFSTEPPAQDNPLLHHPQVVVTPHIGASTAEAQERVSTDIATQVVAALAGGQIVGGVNGDKVVFGR